MHVAVFNIARLVAPMDDPRIDDFRNGLDPINALAEESPGFVWESIDDLAEFTYRSGHLDFLRRRREFFEHDTQAYLVLWWIPQGHVPTMDEAMARLDHLREHGPTPHAFTFRHRFEPGDVHPTQGSDLDTCPA